MIILYHNTAKVVNVISQDSQNLSFDDSRSIASVLNDLAIRYPESVIIWCNEKYQDLLNLNDIESIFHHDKMMLAYNPNVSSFLGEKIGYIDESPFIKVNKKRTFPTWQMSSVVGVIHAKVLLEISRFIKSDSNFDYYLNSIAKVCMPLGLLCYSEPRLLNNKDFVVHSKTSNFTLFRFVKQHYRIRWSFIMLLNLIVFEFKFPLLAFLYGIFFKNRNNSNIAINKIEVNSSLESLVHSGDLDVIIPTIGRKQYLYDILKDLAKQTYLPKNVIVVEQNPMENSTSELDYLSIEKWPFKIKHTFTNQAGACNARNVALNQVESEWVFFADDDIRIDNFFVESAFKIIEKFKCKVVSFNCLQKNQKNSNKEIFQWPAFGSGCSFVKSETINRIRFDLKYEFGFGEDADFGMQLRNLGFDVLYFPTPSILHLKAPVGGFRTKPNLIWSESIVKPKPSPTISLYKILNGTKEQHKGYKVTLFFKFYVIQSVKNPFKYFFKFQKEWKSSLYWANQLINKS